MMEYDWANYPGTWNFCLAVDGLAGGKQEIAVNDANAQGFGIEKVVKRHISEVTVYLLRWEDFYESKESNSYFQPSKAICQTTVKFEDGIIIRI